jgi:hypothetical protein
MYHAKRKLQINKVVAKSNSYFFGQKLPTTWFVDADDCCWHLFALLHFIPGITKP